MKLMLLLPAFLFVVTQHYGQDAAPDIAGFLVRVEKGEANEVRSELPSILSRYPNNPGVLYLQGVLTVDGTEAVRLYQSVVDNFPKSEWADDALYKVYQFYYAIGLYRTAEIKLNQLRTDYSQSKYISVVAVDGGKNLPEEDHDPTQAKPPQEGMTQNIPSTTPPETTRSEVRSPLVVAREVPKGRYAVQVGAFSQHMNAEKQKQFFEDLGFAVEMLNKVKDSRPLYIVRVGEYTSADEARAKGAEFKRKYNINSLVVTR